MKDLNFNEGDINAFGKILENAFDVKPSKREKSATDKDAKLSIVSKGNAYVAEASGSFEDLMNMVGVLLTALANDTFKDDMTAKMIMFAYLTDTIKKLAKEALEGDES